jgi:hypothetical protein
MKVEEAMENEMRENGKNWNNGGNKSRIRCC